MSRFDAARFEAVLFDLDGTLLDSIALILESYRHTLAAHGLPARSDEDVLSGLGTPLEAQFRRWVGEEAEHAETVQALVDTSIAHNLDVHDRFVKPYPGVTELVRRLSGTPVAVVTSKRRRGTEMGLRALGLHDAFEILVCADDVERPKPHPEPVQRALRFLGTDPAKTVFVGDAVHDVEAGKAAGVRTVAVTWGAGRREELERSRPDVMSDDADALARFLFGR